MSATETPPDPDLRTDLARALAATAAELTVRDLGDSPDGDHRTVVEHPGAAGPRRTLRVERGAHFEPGVVVAYFEGNGVALADGYLGFPDEVAAAAVAWLAARADLDAVAARFPDLTVAPPAAGPAVDVAELVAQSWSNAARYLERYPAMGPIVEAARRDPTLGRLYAVTSMNLLCFSRCTLLPFTGDVPAVHSLEPATRAETDAPVPTRYAVRDAWNAVIAVGDAAAALDAVRAALPPGCGPAVYGTARDLPY